MAPASWSGFRHTHPGYELIAPAVKLQGCLIR